MREPKRSGRTFLRTLLAGLLLTSGPVLSGCGLGTAGILVAVLMGGGGDETVVGPTLSGPTILFTEDFETDLSKWSTAGVTPPAISAGGQSGNGLDPGGTTTENGEAVSWFAFNLDPGVAARASMRMPSLGTGNADLWFGFKENVGPDARLGLLAGFVLSGAQSLVRMHVNGISQGDRPLNDTNWHRYEVNVRPDGYVEFFIDGGLALVSTDRVDPLIDYRPVTAGGKSVGAPVILDDVEVFGYTPVRDVEFAESFGTDLSEWTTGSPVGTPPSIDPFVTGNPSPALNPGGTMAGIGEAMTNQTFVFTDWGLEIQGDLYVSAIGVDNLSAWFGLATQSTLPGSLQLAAGVSLSPGAGSNEIRYYLNNATDFTEVLTATGWYRFRVMIRPGPGTDWFVEYYRDGQLVHVSTTPLQVSYDDNPLHVGGQSGAGTARIDNLAVLVPPAFRSPVLESRAETGTAHSVNVEGHVAAVDLERDRVLVAFGGSAAAASADVYAADLSGTDAVWTLLSPTGTAPASRTYAAGFYHEPVDALYVTAGATDASGATSYQDLWYLDFTNGPDGEWIQATPPSMPNSRSGHSFVPDPGRARFILFGGFNGATVNNELWEYDPAADQWNALAPTGGPPSGRRFHAAAVDTANRRMIVFGGEDGFGAAVADTLWALDLDVSPPNWVALTPAGGTGPGARWASGAAVDGHKRLLYLAGGRDGAVPYQELHVLDLAGGADGIWSMELLGGAIGTPHVQDTGVGLTFDPWVKSLFFIGGSGSGAASVLTTGNLEDD
ncbi:MAG: Kelch repeat-containing protein [Planctomycetota bacterium]|jgi:hypothetical protein